MRSKNHAANATGWFPWEYFGVTFAFSWLCWLPGIFATRGLLELPLPWEVFFLLGIFGPLVGAVFASVRKQSWAAARMLLTRVIDIKFGVKWWLTILILPPVVAALSLMVSKLLQGEGAMRPVLVNAWMYFPMVIFMSLIGGGQEEFGWRGYALDILQERWSALRASLVLGLIWGLWHLPLFFVEGTGQYYMPMVAFMLTSPALSILTTWVYNSTGRKLFAAILFHGALNASMDTFPPIQKVASGDQNTFLIICLLLWVWAVGVILWFGRQHLAKHEATRHKPH